MDHRAELFALVERVVDGTIPVAAFEGRFYDFYMDEVPGEALTQPERDFVASVLDKLDLTVEHPDAKGRRSGLIDRAEFVEWLRAHYGAFRSAGGPSGAQRAV